jgi:predicted RND superfamily exporter protein
MKQGNYKTKIQELYRTKVEQINSSLPKILVFLIILLLVGFYFFYNFRVSSSSKIEALLKENEQLIHDNKKLDSSIYENQLAIIRKSNEIAGLTDKDLELQKDVKTLQNKIKNLKSDYEKANNHADNFSSDQLSKYFTDSLR